MGLAVGLLLPDAGAACRAGESACEHQSRLRPERCRRAEFYARPAVVCDALAWPARDPLLSHPSPAAALCEQWTGRIGWRWRHRRGLIDWGQHCRLLSNSVCDLYNICFAGNDRMQSRRTFLQTAAATAILPFARISRSRAAQR